MARERDTQKLKHGYKKKSTHRDRKTGKPTNRLTGRERVLQTDGKREMERKTKRGKQRYRWREIQRGTLRGETEAEDGERAQRQAKREGEGLTDILGPRHFSEVKSEHKLSNYMRPPMNVFPFGLILGEFSSYALGKNTC